MKRFCNDPGLFVRESLEGLAAAHADLLQVAFDPTVVWRADAPRKGQVAVVSGGGSGHEPMHAGFVGVGMLDAACPGEVFTSPTPDQVLEAIRRVDGGAGTLLLVKNYSGDVMNFEMATELAHAEGLKVQAILIDDDVAVKDSLYTQGRRGVGATVVAEKLCGAASAHGASLEEVADVARRVATHARSFGLALSSCTPPLKGTPLFELGPLEIEVGIGIHGEPGRRREELRTADEMADLLVDTILEDAEFRRPVREWADGDWLGVERVSPPLDRTRPLLAFLNGMGGTPLSELYLVYRRVAGRGLPIVRSLVGSYMTSLEMQGCSLTLMPLDDDLLELWDAPVVTPALRW